jgi:hypothetical protein
MKPDAPVTRTFLPRQLMILRDPFRPATPILQQIGQRLF